MSCLTLQTILVDGVRVDDEAMVEEWEGEGSDGAPSAAPRPGKAASRSTVSGAGAVDLEEQHASHARYCSPCCV